MRLTFRLPELAHLEKVRDLGQFFAHHGYCHLETHHTFWQAYQSWEWHIPRMFGGKDVYKNQGLKTVCSYPMNFHKTMERTQVSGSCVRIPHCDEKTLSTIYSKHRAGQKGSRIWWLQLDDLPILLCNLMNSIRISFNVDLIHHQTKLVSPWKYTNVYCSISYYCEQNHNVSCYDCNTPEAWSEQRASTWLARWDHMHPGSFFEPKRWHSKTLLFRVTLFIFVLSFSGWSLVTIKISKHTLMMQFDAIRQYWRRCLELAVMNIPSKWGVKEPRVCQFWFCIMFL